MRRLKRVADKGAVCDCRDAMYCVSAEIPLISYQSKQLQ
jgi:hypothetical protein